MGSDGNYVIYSKGEYNKNGSIWYCEPDLHGFSTGNTYYVTYDSSNTIATTGDKVFNEKPDGWYDYEHQKWANIVTIGNQHIAYWTWVPRYVYKVVNSSDPNSAATDIRFVNSQNQYKDEAGNIKEYSELVAEGYVLADAFKFDDVNVNGIWVAKYEISDPKEPIGFSVQADENSITVYSITWEGESSCVDEALADQVEKATVQITVSGNGYSETFNEKLPYKIENLASGNTYKISVTTPTYGIDPLTLSKNVSTLEGKVADVTSPDLKGFSSDNTYYVTYDEKNTTATVGDKIQTTTSSAMDDGREVATNAPSNWYDYDNQRWANVVTVNHDTGEAIYWVWIPRYEYYVDTEMNICDIIFITAKKTKADDGYSIPDAFTFGTEPLSGIWVAKYEISDVALAKGFYSSVTSDSITITNIVYTDGNFVTGKSMPNSGISIKVTDSSRKYSRWI